MAQVLVFGHSITWGAWDAERGGWVGRLQKCFTDHVDQKWNSDLVYNIGISGDNTRHLLERFEAECKARILESKEYGDENIILFNIGANDSTVDKSDFPVSVPEEEFKSNLAKLIGLAKKFTPKVAFVGSFPVDEERSVPIPWNEKISYRNERVEEYDLAARSVCRELGIPFIDVFGALIKSDYKSLLADGVHPNSAGHEKIFEMVRDFMVARYPKEFSYLK